MLKFRLSFLAGLAGVAILAACSGGGGGGSSAPPTGAGMPPMSEQQAASSAAAPGVAATSVLRLLASQQTVGTVVNPVNGDVNPYGLDVARVSAGKITAGDLVVCDFNDKQNVQGTGTSILVIHPAIGSKPRSLLGTKLLLGCNALALAPDDTIWGAAFGANSAPIVASDGTFLTSLRQFRWHHPFGEAFVPPVNANSVPAFYTSNAEDGSLVRVGITPRGFTFTTIVTGFPVNGGPPGSILAPSGLNYQLSGDRLYVVDGTNNALYAINNISRIVANGIHVNGLTFSGPQANAARVIYHGAPLNGPISSALLFNGNIVLGNTLDPNGMNLMVELSPAGSVLDVKNVDTGAAGAIFGMVAIGTSTATTKLYFNDDNANTLEVLSP